MAQDNTDTLDQPPSPVLGKDAASINMSAGTTDDFDGLQRRPWSKRILAVIWDSLDKAPEERAFIAKIDWWILSYCCIAYFVKYLDQTNVSLSVYSGSPEVWFCTPFLVKAQSYERLRGHDS